MGALSGTVEQKTPKADPPERRDHWYTRFRQRIRRRPAVDLAYRIAIGVIGGAVLAAGVIAIPYPGPGWLIVFTGLAILGTEFHWAQKLLKAARRRYDAWTHWLRRQPVAVRLAVMVLTGVVVLLTLWLVNAFGLVAGWADNHWDWFGVQWEWVRSPLM